MGFDGSIPSNFLPEKDTDGWDSALTAVHHTATEHMLSWKADLNMIVLISNNNWKWSGDNNPVQGPEYKLPPPDYKHPQNPCEQGPVSKTVLYSTLKNRKIMLIGLLTPNIYEEYKSFFNDAPNPENYIMLKINGADEETAEGIKGMIRSIIRERVCKCQVRYEFALMIDSTQTFIGKRAD